MKYATSRYDTVEVENGHYTWQQLQPLVSSPTQRLWSLMVVLDGNRLLDCFYDQFVCLQILDSQTALCDLHDCQ